MDAGASSQLVTITLNSRLAPPTHVEFSRVGIGSVTAMSWSRSGNTLQAWFTIPSSTRPGEYALVVAFPGREGNTVAFRYPVSIESGS